MSLQKKEICLWVIPGASGKVRKLRLNYRLIGALFSLALIVSVMAVYVLSDYGRTKLSKAFLYSLLGSVKKERDILQAQNDALKEEIASLQTVNERAIKYEGSLKQRLEVLSGTLEAASELKAFSTESQDKGDKDDSGVGGLEIDCKTSGECANALDQVLEPDGGTVLASLIKKDFLDKSGQDLIEAMDMYSDIISAIPMGNPGNGYIKSSYGPRYSPFTGRLTTHKGVDYSLPAGSNIIATAAGVVRQVTRTSTYGLMIDIAHTDSIVTRYAHLSGAFVTPGQKVCRGEAIGLVGSTGRSTGPHLHYEIRVNGKSQDPTGLIRLAEKINPALFRFGVQR